MLGQGQGLAAAIVVETAACQQAALLERGEKLGNGRRRDGGAAGELGADELSLADRLHCQVLGNGQRGVVRGEQTLEPAAHEGCCSDESLRRLTAADVMTRPRHSVKYT